MTAVLDLQEQRTVFTRYLNPRVTAKRVAPNVAQAFGDDLKQFRREAIVHLHFAARFYVDFDSRHQ
jgi:hypothetical protein